MAGNTTVRTADDHRPIYVSAISYLLGEETLLSDIADPVLQEQIPALHAQGLKYCRTANRSTSGLAAESVRKSLEGITGQSVAAIVFCTDSEPEKTTTSDIWDFLIELGMPATPVTVVGGSGCGNLGPGLSVARNLVLVDGISPVAVVTADRVTNGTRFLPNGQTAMSDGAASCIVDSRSYGAGFQLQRLNARFQVDIGTTSTRPIIVAKATAQAAREAVLGVAESLSMTPADFRFLLLPNYGLSAQKFLATSAGVPMEQVYCPFLDQVGHCFSADVLLALTSLMDTDGVQAGDHLLLLTMSPRSWSVVAVTYHPAQEDASRDRAI